VTHGDLIAFLLLWIKGVSLEPGNKERLDALGLSDNYPATASITTLVYQTMAEDEVPGIGYVRPYLVTLHHVIPRSAATRNP